MDTLYEIDKTYIENNIDGKLIYSLIRRFSSWYCDSYRIMPTRFKDDRKWNVVPVGDLDFVSNYVGDVKPIEIPECLRKFVKREYKILKGSDIPREKQNKDYFLKDADHLKRWNNSLEYKEIDLKPNTNYVVSKRVDFKAEYRVFVHNDNILACQPYLGEPLVFPNSDYIEMVVNEYSKHDHPKAYTLDIGIHHDVTDIIEIHPFVSCGLYGFYDKEILPMLKDGFDWYKK